LPEILNLIFHNYVLFFEFKYKLTIMQLGLKPRSNKKLVIKITLIILFIFLGIFMLDKIDFPAPKKLIKQQISNDKLITLK